MYTSSLNTSPTPLSFMLTIAFLKLLWTLKCFQIFLSEVVIPSGHQMTTVHRWQLYLSTTILQKNYVYMNETNSVKTSKSVSENFLFLHEPTTMRAFPCIAKYNGIEAKCLWYTQKPLQKSSHELAESWNECKVEWTASFRKLLIDSVSYAFSSELSWCFVIS